MLLQMVLSYNLHNKSVSLDYYLPFTEEESKACRNDISSKCREHLNLALFDFLSMYKCFQSVYEMRVFCREGVCFSYLFSLLC